MFLTSFLFLDWKYSFFNLPYQFDMELELNEQSIQLKLITFNQMFCYFRSIK